MNDVSLAGNTMYIQDAVYWSPLEPDDNGVVNFADPIAVRVRWKDESAMFMDKQGNQQVSHARVRVNPATPVKELGVLWLGLLADLTDSDNPFLNDGAYEIRKRQLIPSRRGNKSVQIAIL